MTPAELARYSAISFECKKDSLRQNQSGTWRIAFTVQGLDMDERLTKAFPGTRYMAVLVEIDDLELPVHRPAKESNSPSSEKEPATPSLSLDRLAEKAKRKHAKRDWRELQPSAQAYLLCEKPVFHAFLKESYPDEWHESMTDAAECVRLICAVESRALLNDGAHRVIWHSLNEQYDLWALKERVGV